MQTTPISRPQPPQVERFRLEGHVTAESIQVTLDDVTRRLAAAPRPSVLLIDLLVMKSYEPACRTAFTSWYRRNAHFIRAVAGVTDRASWRVIISAIGLATRGQFKSFDAIGPALEWAKSLPGD
jgi:hypothetical protein